MKYKFSVIIPVYNAEKTLRRCLDSLLCQNYPYAEIILINDGSKDSSGKICQEYASNHSCIVYLEQANAGASSARNAGLRIASGEYITFVDSDDYVADTYFSELEKNDADFLVFSYSSIRSHNVSPYNLPNELFITECKGKFVLSIINSRIAAPWNKRFRTEIIKENNIRFKPDLIIGEDFIFGLEYMLACQTCCAITSNLYFVDETGATSITRSAQYDFSQFLLIYQYAFPIAQLCTWDTTYKYKLIQTLDYLYCRTSFASMDRYLSAKKVAHWQPCDLIQVFHDQQQKNIRPLNWAHFLMQLCLHFKLTFVYYCVSYLHQLLAKT